MTNGEKLIEVFPSIGLYKKAHDGIQINFNSVWFNAEYKEPTTKNDLGVDCISRDVVKNYIQAHIHEIITESGEDKNKHTNRVLRSMIHGVNCMPSVTPQEPKTGHWMPSHIPESILDECSECGFSCGAFTFNYCPNCGAKMAESEADNGNDD